MGNPHNWDSETPHAETEREHEHVRQPELGVKEGALGVSKGHRRKKSRGRINRTLSRPIERSKEVISLISYSIGTKVLLGVKGKGRRLSNIWNGKVPLAQSNLYTTEAYLGVTGSESPHIPQLFIQHFSEEHSCDCKPHQNPGLETSAQAAASVMLLSEQNSSLLAPAKQ